MQASSVHIGHTPVGGDGPAPIGFEKTISQPFIVALMTDLLDIKPQKRRLTAARFTSALLPGPDQLVSSNDLREA
jgi:hypothetical protein